ncbi:hypothetical protein CHS0354_014975 [Potamilus streckersoni]|uniref:DZIP3-like HEPN domain-containing protein n=1 Tax=Potamilus streckersoni TaxID=2493646 RepID=A0AAE0SAG6_9BIVA|nr:hypothetical protein CHS0354_014975 [Potamilus streckersoni]
METESLSWFRLLKCLVTIGTDVLHELLKFNIETYSFSEYHKLWLKKVDLIGKSNGLHMLWTSLDQEYRSLDASSQQSLQSLFIKLKHSSCSTSMEICKQISVLKDWEDEIQNYMNKHPTQQNVLCKWLTQVQELATSNASLIMVFKHWTKEFINLCQAEQLNLLRLIFHHHERINNLLKDFLKKIEFSIIQGRSELHNVFKAIKQDERNSQFAFQSELGTFLISWQPKINRLLNVWITDVSSNPHKKILQTLVMDIKNCLLRVYQMCQTSVLGICSTWHKNLRKRLAEYESKLHLVSPITSDLQDIVTALRDDIEDFPSALDQQIRDFFDSKKPDLKRLKTCGIITDPQWSLLYPANGHNDLRTFDISLLCTLHRNVFPVCPPELGWCGEILETDHSIGADFMRLIKMRNDLVTQIPDSIPISPEIEKLWHVLEASLLRLSNILDGEFKAKIKTKIADSKTYPFDFCEEINLQLDLINWYKNLDLHSVKDEVLITCLGLIQTIQNKIEALHQNQSLNISEKSDFTTKMDTVRKEVIERLPRSKKRVDEITSGGGRIMESLIIKT